MKKLLALLLVPTLGNASVLSDHSDGYKKKKAGEEPYATHFSAAEIHCIGEGYTWPGFLTGEKASQLQTSEMILCIEEAINNQIEIQQIVDDGHKHRLLEIEEALQKLMLERQALTNGG